MEITLTLVCIQLVLISQLLQAITMADTTKQKNIKLMDSMKGSFRDSYMDNMDCAAYEYILSTDSDHHLYMPYYVKLFRCQGADLIHAPTNRICTPVEPDEVNVVVNIENGEAKIITLLNHTKCEYRCKDKICTKYQKWNEDTCTCDCNPNTKMMCEKPKVWDQANCCTCASDDIQKCESARRTLDKETCQCMPGTGKSKGVGNENSMDVGSVIIIASLELIFVVIICMLTFYCCCYRQHANNFSVVTKMDFNNQCYPNTTKIDKNMIRLSEDSLQNV